jgi:hypothetical protein
MKTLNRLLAVACMALLFTGCEKGPPPGPPLAKPALVSGHIKLRDGSLLKGGVVTFVPVEIEAGSELRYQGAGLVDAQGAYKIGFNNNNEGVPPGEYKVVVEPRDYQELRGSNSSQIPKSYRAASTTPLTLTVEDKDNVFEIVLK